MTGPTRYSVQLRSRLDGNTLHGHASVFGQLAQVPGGYEQIAPSAFNAVLDRSDTDARALINHDPNLLLGRQSSGTLRLKADGDGLAFEVDLPDTSYAADLRALVARGDLTGASFAFIPGEEEWTTAPDGMQLRTHTAVSALLDVSAVTYPAYETAGVALRFIDFGRPSGRDRLVRARARVLLGKR